MIVKMSKYAFLVFHKEYDSFLNTLRDLGVVHVKQFNSVLDNASLQTLLADRKRIDQTLRFCKRSIANNKDVKVSEARRLTKEEGLKLVDKLDILLEKEAQLRTMQTSLEKDIAYMDIWGDFSYEYINRLRKSGLEVTFFTCPTAKYEPKWGEEYHAFLVNSFQSVSYFVTVTKKGVPIEIDADRPKMPPKSQPELNKAYLEVQKDLKNVIEEQKVYAAEQYQTLIEVDKTIQNEFNMSNTIYQTDTEADDKLMLLEGFLPTEDVQKMEDVLNKGDYYYMPLDIAEGEKVPIKLHNNRFTRVYEPITRMFSLPNYAEFDPTPFFAPFFMLFFGLCFGDGGYGLLVVIACTLLKRKAKETTKPVFELFQWLGLAAIIVGTLTGSFFGIALVDVPAFKSVKSYFLTSDNLMTLSIVIGLVQIIFGKTVAALKIMSERGSKYGVAPMAWVFVIISLCVALGLPVLKIQLPEMVKNICYGIAALGLLIAFFYNIPGKNIFLNFGNGLWTAYGMASGLLGDTLSYIRLFAIGLTGSILGGVFNTLAIDMTSSLNILLRIPCMLLILAAGHTINFGLCTISSLVHPLRLIFVEYYKNADFEGGGKEYLPFKKA